MPRAVKEEKNAANISKTGTLQPIGNNSNEHSIAADPSRKLDVISLPKKRELAQRRKLVQRVTLNGDCWEHIFQYLDLNDLVRVASINDEMCWAACLIYKRKYHLDNVFFENSRTLLCCSVGGHKVVPKNTMNFIAYFGHLFFKVSLRKCGSNYSACKVFRKFLDHATDQIRYIKFIDFPSRTRELLIKPIDATHIEFENCALTTKFSILCTFFPKMTSLKIINCSLPKQEHRLCAYPNLETLTIMPGESMTYCLSDILHENPQIRKIKLGRCREKHFLEIDAAEQLEYLDVHIVQPCRKKMLDKIHFTFKQLKEIKINLSWILAADGLESLRINSFLEGMEGCKKLEKVRLEHDAILLY